MDNQVKVAEALSLLGSAYRGDWSNFDGRSLRSELDDLAGALQTSVIFDLDRWVIGESICPQNRSWAEHCPERGQSFYSCAHLEKLTEKLAAGKVIDKGASVSHDPEED